MQMELAQLENQVNQLKSKSEMDGNNVSQVQVEIEENTKLLMEIESETSNHRNQLSSLENQKMKLVQEGT